jgi:hypothetical protein
MSTLSEPFARVFYDSRRGRPSLKGLPWAVAELVPCPRLVSKKGSRWTWTRSGICQVRLENSFVRTKSCAAVRQPCPATGQCRGDETEL